MVLRAIGETVEEEIDRQECEAPERVFLGRRRFLFCRGVVEGKDGNAGSNEEYYEVFVKWVAFAEDGEVEEHHREEFARLGKDIGYIIDMGERCVAEGRGQRGSDGNQDQRHKDACRGEDGWCAGRGTGGGKKVHVAGKGSETGLDGVEEDGVFKLRRGF